MLPFNKLVMLWHAEKGAHCSKGSRVYQRWEQDLNLRGLVPSGSRGRRLTGLGYPSAILIFVHSY